MDACKHPNPRIHDTSTASSNPSVVLERRSHVLGAVRPAGRPTYHENKTNEQRKYVNECEHLRTIMHACKHMQACHRVYHPSY